MGTTVPAAKKQLAAQLRLRANLAGVAVHPVDLGIWTDNEAIVLGQVTAPQAWLGMRTLGSLQAREDATLSGYIFAQLAGNTDTAGEDAQDRAGVLLDELVAQTHTDPNVNGAIPTSVARIPPLLTTATWTIWPAEVNGVGVFRARVDFQLTWQARTT